MTCRIAAREYTFEQFTEVEIADFNDEQIAQFAHKWFKARQALIEGLGELEFEVDEIQFVPNSTTSLSGDDKDLFDTFIEMLNDVDDVQRVFHNVE